MLGFLIDEDEFEVSPAISRIFQVVETDTKTTKRQRKRNEDPSSFTQNLLYVVGNTTLSQLYDYTSNIIVGEPQNVNTFDVFINNDYYGSDVTEIQMNQGDVLKIVVEKNDDSLESTLILYNNLV